MSDRPDIDDEQLTLDDFLTLPVEYLADVTGLPAPVDPTDEQEIEWRRKAYDDYALDLENRAEWGTAAQGRNLPGEGGSGGGGR